MHFIFNYISLKGWFPVKMKTFVADPIEFDENNTVDDLDCLV